MEMPAQGAVPPIPVVAPRVAPADADRVRRATSGDRDAFEALATAAMPRLIGTASRLLGPGFAAEEAVADALFRGWQSVGRFRGASTFHTWLHRILCRVVADRFRADSRDRRQSLALARRLGGAPTTSDPLERIAETELRHRLREATDRLPPMQRLVLLLVAWEGLSLRDVATVLDVRYATAKSNLNHARRAIRRQLEEGDAS